MRTNIDIDERLIKRAMKKAGVRTKREAVAIALQHFVRRPDYPSLLSLFGSGGIIPGYDPKAPYGGLRPSRTSGK